VDNGSAFRSKNLERTAAELGIALSHSRPYKPQGRGKIERFFRTVRTEFLSTFNGNSLDDLNETMGRWLSSVYHQRRHSATGETPLRRYTARLECLRTAPENLSDYFRIMVRRRVNKDRSVIVDRRLYEAPVTLVGKRVEILFHETNTEAVEIRCEGKGYGMIRQVDPHINCRFKRDKSLAIQLDEPAQSDPPKSGGVFGG